MSKPTLEIIVAVDSCGGFGKDGKIPWTCKEDMNRFATISKEIGVVVMGRHTYTDMVEMRGTDKGVRKKIIKHGILPHRKSYVVSSTLEQADVIGATVVKDLRAVLNEYHNTDQRIAVIGGEKLYIQALSSATKVHMSIMDNSFNCDRFFPLDALNQAFAIPNTGSTSIQADVDGTTQTVRFISYESRRT